MALNSLSPTIVKVSPSAARPTLSLTGELPPPLDD
jgi:hypothetical protein